MPADGYSSASSIASCGSGPIYFSDVHIRHMEDTEQEIEGVTYNISLPAITNKRKKGDYTHTLSDSSDDNLSEKLDLNHILKKLKRRARHRSSASFRSTESSSDSDNTKRKKKNRILENSLLMLNHVEQNDCYEDITEMQVEWYRNILDQCLKNTTLTKGCFVYKLALKTECCCSFLHTEEGQKSGSFVHLSKVLMNLHRPLPFPHFFLNHNMCDDLQECGKCSFLRQDLENNEADLWDKADEGIRVKFYSLLSILYIKNSKLGLAEVCIDTASEILLAPDENVAWLFLAKAFFWNSFQNLNKYSEYYKKIQEFLVQARCNFHYAVTFGHCLQLERALCLWWQIYIKIIGDNGKSNNLPYILLNESVGSLKDKVNMSDFNPREIRKLQLMLNTFREEVNSLGGLEEETKQVMIDTALEVLEFSKQNGDEKASNYNHMSIQLCFEEFEIVMERQEVPSYIMGYNLGVGKLKIFVDVDVGKSDNAEAFFQQTIPELYGMDIISTVEQQPPEYLMDPENKAVFATLGDDYKAKFKFAHIQSGSQIAAIINESHIDILSDKDMKEIEDIQRKYKTGPSGSLGCFMEDNLGAMYAISARHPFMWIGDDYVPLPGSSEDSTVIVAESEEGVKEFSSQCYSCFDYLQIHSGAKAVDIAALSLKEDIKPYSNLHIENEIYEKVSLKVFQDDDFVLHGKQVQKTGPITGKTFGQIVFANRKTKINGKFCTGTFFVKGRPSAFKGNAFVKKGDSGSLVLTELKRQRTAIAYGLCYMVHSAYKNEDVGITLTNVTECVRLDYGLQMLKDKFGLCLTFPSEKENTVDAFDSGFVSGANSNGQSPSFLECHSQNPLYSLPSLSTPSTLTPSDFPYH